LAISWKEGSSEDDSIDKAFNGTFFGDVLPPESEGEEDWELADISKKGKACSGSAIFFSESFTGNKILTLCLLQLLFVRFS